MIISDPIGAHLRWCRLLGHTEGTIYSRQRALARMQAQIPVPLIEATTAHLRAWRDQLELSPSAINGYVSHARTFYAWTIEAELRADNPAAGLPVPRLGRMLPRPIGEDDLRMAVELAPRRVRPWLVLAGWAGLRAKEIALLRRDRILDSASPPMLIISADATKGRSERIIPLSRLVLAELASAGLPAAGYVFRRQDHQPGPNQPWLISHLANRHLHDCGIGATLHQLRHRFGTQAWHGSHDLRLVQELLGHAYPNTTAGYTAYDRGSAIAVVEALAECFTPKTQKGG